MTKTATTFYDRRDGRFYAVDVLTFERIEQVPSSDTYAGVLANMAAEGFASTDPQVEG